MGRIGVDDYENYGNGSGTNFFSLRDDGEVATVRFMYRDAKDIVGYAAHKVKIGDRDRFVNCLREYNEPVDKCPFCRAHMFQTVKLYVPVYNEDTKEVQLWERGKKFFGKLSSLCSRYTSADTPLVAYKFEIERCGKKGDKETTYEIYPGKGGPDNTTLEDLPEIPDALGVALLSKTPEEMEYFLDNEEFPPEGGTGRRSRDNDDRDDRRQADEQPTRRTPRGRGDREAF